MTRVVLTAYEHRVTAVDDNPRDAEGCPNGASPLTGLTHFLVSAFSSDTFS